MDDPRRSSAGRRVRARVARTALIAVIAVAGLVATPGAASAAGAVKPFVDCSRQHANGTHTVVLGYENTSTSTITIPVGLSNTVAPAWYDGGQPTAFEPGVHRGAFSVTVSGLDYVAGGSWLVGVNSALFGTAWEPFIQDCPPSTELPADGNEIGPVIALAAAGVVGALVVRRVRRRASGRTGGGQEQEAVDA